METRIPLCLQPIENIFYLWTGQNKYAIAICETYCRRDAGSYEASQLPLSIEEEVRARKRRQTTKAQHWTKFRVNNI